MEYFETAQESFTIWMNGLSVEESLLIAVIGLVLIFFAVFALLMHSHFSDRSSTVVQPSSIRIVPGVRAENKYAKPAKKRSFFWSPKPDPFLSRLDRLG